MTRTRAALDGARTRISAARGARLVLPVLLVAAVAAAAFLSRDADHPEMPTAATARTLAAVTLPDGQSLQAARGGVIDRMVAFLSEEGIKDEKVFLLDGIQFDDRSATLRSASLAKLEQVAAVLAAFPGARVDIEAPAGSLGDPERERDLAEHRALAVRAALGSFGIRPSRMTHAAATRAAGSETGVSQFSDGVIALRVTTG
jgi:outer membrane protein OmpA-like peptidoglycan-associated protein